MLKSKKYLTAGVMLAAGLNANAATISLSGSDASGYLSLSGLNNEFGEEYAGTDKGFEYPYYWNEDKGYWEVIVAESLSSSSVYAQEDVYSVLGKDFSDADFSDFNVGSISYDDSLVAATGVSVVSVEQLTLDIDESEFNPNTSTRNVDNEFSWVYDIQASNLAGDGLTFVDGVLTDIDVDADLSVGVLLNGFLAVTWDTPSGTLEQAASLAISGDQIIFDFDQTGDATSLVGPLDDARLAITRAGTLDAVAPVPLPGAAIMFLTAFGGLGWFSRRRKAKLA